MLIQRRFDDILHLEVPANELGLQIRLLLTAKEGADEESIAIVDKYLETIYAEIQSGVQ